MKRGHLAVVLVLLLSEVLQPASPPARFEKVSDHFYFLQIRADLSNAGALVTNDGVGVINAPPDADVQIILDALKRITAKPVRWVINTDYQKERAGGGGYFVKHGAQHFLSREMQRLTAADAKPERDSTNPPAASQSGKAADKPEQVDESYPLPDILFGHQMRLYPDGVETRILAVSAKARTAGDVVIYLPAEKVLMVGDLFTPGSYPDIDDASGEGSALGWIEGMKQVIDAVPLLKPAIPQPKVETDKAPVEEKSLEELITVIPGRGPRSNLKEMKSLLEMAHKLRGEIAKAAAAGRDRDSFLSLPFLGIYRTVANYDDFAAKLFDELGKAKTR